MSRFAKQRKLIVAGIERGVSDLVIAGRMKIDKAEVVAVRMEMGVNRSTLTQIRYEQLHCQAASSTRISM